MISPYGDYKCFYGNCDAHGPYTYLKSLWYCTPHHRIMLKASTPPPPPKSKRGA